MPWAPETVLAAFLVFCRIGACLMVMPGFSSARVPMRMRLFLAVAVSLALTPLLLQTLWTQVSATAAGPLFASIAAELFTGFTIGFLARLFFLALETIGTSISQAIGLSGIPGMGLDDGGPQGPLTSLIMMTATTLMFVTDQHWVLVRGLVDSYTAIPPGQAIDVQMHLIEVTDQLTDVFLLVLRIGAPFLVYSILINFAIGLTNKLTPQIPVYFIAMPFVTAGGLFLLYFAIVEFMVAFTGALGTWLLGG